MMNQLLIFGFLLTLLAPSFSFLFAKKDKRTTPDGPLGSSSSCTIGQPLKDEKTNRIISCNIGLYNNCPQSHQCVQKVCCLLPESEQFNPCRNGSPLRHPTSKAYVSCTSSPSGHYSCPTGYECNTEIQDVASTCCPVTTSSFTSRSSTPEIQELVANVSALWHEVNELQKCCHCGQNLIKSHDSHVHEHNHSHENHQHVAEQHGAGGDHFHDHKHGKHYFDQKSAEVHAHCEMKPNGALPISKIIPIRGFIHLKQTGSGTLQLHVSLSGWPISLESTRTVGIHTHEFGDLRNGCQSVGEHYNPANVSHGGPSDVVRHPGDFGNFQIKPEGKVNAMKDDNMASLSGKFSLIGRAIVIHDSYDDLGRSPKGPLSQITGNSGARLACCVIGYASQEH